MLDKPLRSIVLISGLFLYALTSYGHSSFPDVVEHLIKKSSIPKESISISVQKISRGNLPTSKYVASEILDWQENKPMNPASTMKLVTSLAAMEMLGPQYRWKTDLFTNGQMQGDTLKGDLLLKGSGDPKLIPEEISKLFSNLKALGIKKISGDLIFDRTAYEKPQKESSFSDGETQRSYNASPDALLFAFNSLSFQFLPNSDNDLVVIKQTPRLADLKIDNNLKVIANPFCVDWKKDIQMSLEKQPNGSWLATFNGAYPSGCKNATWNIVASDIDSFLSQSVIAAWEDVGGVWIKTPIVKSGHLNNSFKPIMTHFGIPLYESVKDINKFSNNVMAKQLFLTISLEKTGKASDTENSEKLVREWLKKSNLDMPELVIENGSGLSRIERISSKHLNDILVLGLNSNSKSYYTESLPIAGVDGTMKHRLLDKIKKYLPNKKENDLLKANTQELPAALQKYGAYIKTGSLMDVRSISGYVISRTGQVYAITSFINHPNAHSGRNIHDALLAWLLDDGPNN